MTYFLDTSALVKCYLEESGSNFVRNLVESAEIILISALTEVEMVSAVEKSKREKWIDSPAYRKIMAKLESDLMGEPFRAVVVTMGQLNHAKRLVRRHQLRAADAIQLASAIDALKKVDGHHEFLGFDRALSDAARLEGLKCASL